MYIFVIQTSLSYGSIYLKFIETPNVVIIINMVRQDTGVGVEVLYGKACM